MSACIHGWQDDNFIKCPACRDGAEIAALRSSLRASEEGRARAEAERDEWNRQTERALVDLAAAEAEVERLAKESGERGAIIEIVRSLVEEMHSDATRPKGGQSVSPRRMPVPLSVIKELQAALRDSQGAYTWEEWLKVNARAEAAEARASALAGALREVVAVIPAPYSQDSCEHGYVMDDIDEPCPFEECEDRRSRDLLTRARRVLSGEKEGAPTQQAEWLAAVAKARDLGFRAGAEWMREQAARGCDEYAKQKQAQHLHPTAYALREAAIAIRSLPVSPPAPEEDK